MDTSVVTNEGLSIDRMLEAEVALRLALYLLSLPDSGSMASVTMDGIKVRGLPAFDIDGSMAQAGWSQIKAPNVTCSTWTGAYSCGEKTIRVHSRAGEGDVVTHVNGRRIAAKCTKGPLVRRAANPEVSLLMEALGQALVLDVARDDAVVVAVPDTPGFRQLADQWRGRPLVKKAGIQIALVSRDGTVSGLAL
jgi:hypothetical protein